MFPRACPSAYENGTSFPTLSFLSFELFSIVCLKSNSILTALAKISVLDENKTENVRSSVAYRHHKIIQMQFPENETQSFKEPESLLLSYDSYRELFFLWLTQNLIQSIPIYKQRKSSAVPAKWSSSAPANTYLSKA